MTGTVEADESLFFHRRNGVGRQLQQIWVLGLIERDTYRLVCVILKNRS